MSAPGSALSSQLRRIATNWPADPIRPNMQLKTFLESLAEHPNLASRPAAVEAAKALQENRWMKKVSLAVCVGCLVYRGSFAFVPCFAGFLVQFRYVDVSAAPGSWACLLNRLTRSFTVVVSMFLFNSTPHRKTY